MNYAKGQARLGSYLFPRLLPTPITISSILVCKTVVYGLDKITKHTLVATLFFALFFALFYH